MKNIIEKIDNYLNEKLDKFDFHTSVENGKFMKRFGKMYLHDLDKKNPEGKHMLVTFDELKAAKKAAKKYKGKVEKQKFGTFRIVKE